MIYALILTGQQVIHVEDVTGRFGLAPRLSLRSYRGSLTEAHTERGLSEGARSP